MSTILIVGQSFSGLNKYIVDQGDEYILLRDKHRVINPGKQIKRRVLSDFSDESNIIAAADELHNVHAFDAVYALYEQYVVIAAKLAERYSLAGCPVAAAQACTDKFVMRQLFARAPAKISPDFAIVNTAQDLTDFARSHAFPLIIKPTNLAKSLLVSKVSNESEMLESFSRIQAKQSAIYKRYAPHQKPQFLIEEFMEGTIHSVDAFVDSTGQPFVLQEVVDYQTGHDIGYDDNFHYSRLLPSALPSSSIQEIRETAALGCRALGMKSTAAHVEVILTTDGPRIVEIGARNGGYRSRMHDIANGIDITGNALRLSLGKTPIITPKRNDPFAVFELFPKTPGIFTGVAHEAELQKLPSLIDYKLKYKPGDKIGKSSDGYKMTAVVMLHNTDAEQFKRDVDFVNTAVYVTTSTD